ncbi:MAG TPA: hypothetical protein VFE47_28620 [Tepidisphaeraceae bacterium]|nr:hypothetical protein [Tepidisphaeraceae bacterium]
MAWRFDPQTIGGGLSAMRKAEATAWGQGFLISRLGGGRRRLVPSASR